jgi:hypothetical protein
LASYGLGGLIFVTMVLPMAVWILKYLLRQIAELKSDLERMRSDAVQNRTSLEAAVNLVAESTRSVVSLTAIMERSRT